MLDHYVKILDNLNTKNNEISQINDKYDEIIELLNTKTDKLNSKNIQYKNIIIESNYYDNKNNYSFNLSEELNNVYRIDLVSYEIPNLKYNITLDNNKLKFEIGDEIEYNTYFDSIKLPNQNNNTYGEIIIIEPDNYNIDKLILYLNSFTKSNKIYFDYNNNKLKNILYRF